MDWNSKLPKLLAGEELKEAMIDAPEYSDSIREEDAATRLMALSDIYKISNLKSKKILVHFLKVLKAGRRSLILYHGMELLQSTIYEIGHQSMRRWERALP